MEILADIVFGAKKVVIPIPYVYLRLLTLNRRRNRVAA